MDMSKTTTFLIVVTLAAGAGAAAAEQAAPAKAAAKKGEAVLWPAADIKWTSDPGGSGVQTAVAWGDPKTGAHGTFVKFPAGTQVPLHHHSAEHKGVVVSGTVVIGPEGGTAKELGPGSYALVPAGLKHTTSCKAGGDCTLFVLLSGPDDTILASPAPPKK